MYSENRMRVRALIVLILLFAVVIFLLGLGWLTHSRSGVAPGVPGSTAALKPVPHLPSATDATAENAPTNLYAHNLLLRQGRKFRAYIPWMRGQLLRTRPDTVPSFDVPDSFVINVQRGVIDMYLNDMAQLFNSGAVPHSPFSNASFTVKDGEVNLRGTLHKLVPLPFELAGSLSPMPGGKVRLHVSNIHLLKLPMTRLLGGLHITIADLVRRGATGVRVEGNDIILEPKVLLPPPHIGGDLTAIRSVTLPGGPGLEATYGNAGSKEQSSVRSVELPGGPGVQTIYGNARNDEQREHQWHDFLQLTNGSLSFGKLTMHHVDLIMIDASSKDPWFDLDLSNYEAQLVSGITRTTPQAGLEIFMPGLDQVPKANAGNAITMEWLKDRNQPPPVTMPRP